MVVAWIISAVWSIVCRPLRMLQWSLLQSGNQAYSSLDHLALNIARPSTEWLNMGDWSSTDEFAEACHSLAQLLFKKAGLTSNASILDVGHGSGDSLLLLAKEYSPHLLHGVTTIQSHASRARLRLKRQENEAKISLPSWQVFQEDAVKFLKQRQEPKYNVIFALDCAYHFQTRKEFLGLCQKSLLPGGKIALIDLAASHPYPSTEAAYFTPSPSIPAPDLPRVPLSARIKHNMTTILAGVPLGNLVSIDQYHDDLISSGFDNITMTDTSHLVFPGFARFLKGFGKGEEAAWRGGGLLQQTALRFFGSIVESWSKGSNRGMVRSVLVVASKKGV